MRMAQRTEKDTIDVIYPHPCKFVLIYWLSDLIADSQAHR